MNFYNKCFHQLINNLDPDGMLNVPFNVFNERRCLDVYFRTNNDFQKLDVPWMCDQLIIILIDSDNIFSNLTTPFIQNDFQRSKYTFIFITQALIGLIAIHKESIKAYYRYYDKLTLVIHQKKNIAPGINKNKKRKKSVVINQSLCEELLQNHKIDTLNQNQLIPTSNERSHHELDVLLGPNNLAISHIIQNSIPNLDSEENINSILRKSNLIQAQVSNNSIEEFPILNQNMLIENPLWHSQLDQQLMHIDDIQLINVELQQNLKDQQNGAVLNLQDNQNQMNDSPENNLNNQSLKRKRSSKLIKRNKKRPIEQSNKVLKNNRKKLEEELHDRPLECLAMKYIVNHLPLRYVTYCINFNIPFAALTLETELEENKNQDDLFNHEINMSCYKTITEKLVFNSNNCIYQQSLNNSLPHLSMVPFFEENLIENSLAWRNTINEANKKLDDSLNDILISKTDQNKWEEIKNKIKRSIVAHKTLISHEISRHIDLPRSLLDFPTLGPIDKCLNGNTMIEPNNFTGIEVPQIDTGNTHQMSTHNQPLPARFSSEKSSGNHIQPNINNESIIMDRFDNNYRDSRHLQNVDEPVEVYCKQPMDMKISPMEMISVILKQCPEKRSCLMFTDLCPLHITNRKYAGLVFVELLKLHYQGIVKLSQPQNIIKPSSISVRLNMDYFKKS